MGQVLNAVRSLPISEKFKKKILGDNASQILGIKP
jgi:predicted TIM-barrel fold metal-dependent hydrolase